MSDSYYHTVLWMVPVILFSLTEHKLLKDKDLANIFLSIVKPST